MSDTRTTGTVRLNKALYERMMESAGKLKYSASQFAETVIEDALDGLEKSEPEFSRVVKMLRAIEPRKKAK